MRFVDGVEKGSDPKDVDTAHGTSLLGRNLSTANFFDGLIDEYVTALLCGGRLLPG
jgi:hypothetical protein